MTLPSAIPSSVETSYIGTALVNPKVFGFIAFVLIGILRRHDDHQLRLPKDEFGRLKLASSKSLIGGGFAPFYSAIGHKRRFSAHSSFRLMTAIGRLQMNIVHFSV
jgi:hypothetical protein